MKGIMLSMAKYSPCGQYVTKCVNNIEKQNQLSSA